MNLSICSNGIGWNEGKIGSNKDKNATNGFG